MGSHTQYRCLTSHIKGSHMDNIYTWLGIDPTANEAEILAAIARKKQGYQINTTQEVHIKQVLLTPHLRKHHDARVAAADHPTAFATDDTAAFDINAQGTLTYTPAENRMLATHTKLKKTKVHPSNILYISLAVALLAFLCSLLFQLSAI